MPAVRTVLGDIDPSQLGRVDYHEHLFQVSPLLVGDELDDEGASGEEAGLLRASGFEAMVDATPFGLGRDPAAVARISAATGLHVVATTGRHREAHYGPDHPMQVWGADRLAALFVSDLTRGMPADDAAVFETPDVPLAAGPGGEPVRAGMLKGGADYWRISPFERTTLVAVARAHRETGAPVMVHLEFGTAAHEVLDLLEAEGWQRIASSWPTPTVTPTPVCTSRSPSAVPTSATTASPGRAPGPTRSCWRSRSPWSSAGPATGSCSGRRRPSHPVHRLRRHAGSRLPRRPLPPATPRSRRR